MDEQRGHLSGGVWIFVMPFLILLAIIVIAFIVTIVKFIVSLVRFLKADNEDRDTKKQLGKKALGLALKAVPMLVCLILVWLVFFRTLFIRS